MRAVRRQPYAAILLALGVTVVSGLTARPAQAECLRPDPWPSMRTALPIAERALVGTVTEDRDPNSSLYLAVFGLRVSEVLRGPTPAEQTIEVDHLMSGLPSQGCPSAARVLLGDVIAIALDARSDSGGRINAIAYIDADPDPDVMPGVERLSLAELRALARESGPRPTSPTALPALVLLVVAVSLVVAVGLLRPAIRRAP